MDSFGRQFVCALICVEEKWITLRNSLNGMSFWKVLRDKFHIMFIEIFKKLKFSSEQVRTSGLQNAGSQVPSLQDSEAPSVLKS